MTKIFNPVAEDDTRLPSVNDGPLVNQMGLSRKYVFHAVDKCLERLGTDYIGKPLIFMKTAVMHLQHTSPTL